MKHPLVEILKNDLQNDIRQMEETGHDPAALLHEFEQAGDSLDALAALQQDLWTRPSPADFPYVEPDSWEEISATFPDPAGFTGFGGTDEELADRLLAAWEGRCAGCQLGKPLEGPTWPDRIRKILEFVGSWPLEDYMHPMPGGFAAEMLPDCEFFQADSKWRNLQCKGQFDRVSTDDDINYSIFSLLLLEKHGPEFTSEEAARSFVSSSPLAGLAAAGRNLYRTFIFGITPPATGVYGNPCRQSLGAQIRCDPFGWCAPGNPPLAARMAYRDAVNSQTRNGVYSGIFFATLMADVLAHGDIGRAIETARSYLPPRSRFAEMVAWIRTECARTDDWEEINRAILAKYQAEARKFNHSLPNGAIVLASLLLGGGDFSRTIGICVMMGLDTDCTAATAGSIMGCALGTAGIPRRWIEPFNDRVNTLVVGLQETTISDLARRTFEVARAFMSNAER